MRGKILELLKPDAIKKLFKENPYLYILLINLAAILFILIPEYIPQETKDLLLRIFLLVAFLSLLNIWIKNTIFTFFRNLQVSIFIFIFFILLAQLLYVVFPSIYPRYIANFVESSVTKEMKSKAVEYLDQSPFAKPKANVLIRVPGEYGNEYDFEYESKVATDTKFIKYGRLLYLIQYVYPELSEKQKYWDIYTTLLESFRGL